MEIRPDLSERGSSVCARQYRFGEERKWWKLTTLIAWSRMLKRGA